MFVATKDDNSKELDFRFILKKVAHMDNEIIFFLNEPGKVYGRQQWPLVIIHYDYLFAIISSCLHFCFFLVKFSRKSPSSSHAGISEHLLFCHRQPINTLSPLFSPMFALVQIYKKHVMN